ncbi:hypothetical protein [Spongiactinospora sp. TRM90649]|uniref:hypothetical protein n=1 Tax=Spongiactinospora sp. TRM90649 TaxID=3031114 RepID=UPI0023F7AC82|nr:hypothetical protein [Spongiactinospora sp. TRM90649]MDF5756602.1 hypothetical protein [Spongiactinospora sp. TRM90649]
MEIKIMKALSRLTAVTAAVVLALTGCTGGMTDDQKRKRDAYDAAMKAVGGFPDEAVKQNPTELANARRKLIADSDPNRLSYIYLLSMDGKVIAHFVAKGKVSSADSQMLPDYEHKDLCGTGACYETVNASGDDMTYGNREPGIFFFTPENMLVTWSGDYLQFDRPMKIRTPISLVAEVG